MDAYVLVGPNGSQINLGSYIVAEEGPDFGEKDLRKFTYAENPFAEGGVSEGETLGVRSFKFPLRVASSAVFSGGLPGIEAAINSLAVQGAHIDLMPDGTATENAVRFDVIGGKYEEDYSIHQQRLSRREGLLTLDVQPLGYWPTEIILASVASIGLPGRLSITGASVVGDVLAAAKLTVQPTSPTSYTLGTWVPDMLAWSIGARASMVPFIPAASIASAIPGTLAGNAFAPGSQAINLFPSPTQNTWKMAALATIASALEPAYRGQYRAFAWAQLSPSQAMPFQLSIDAVPAANAGAALASAQSVATLAPIVRGASIAAASPAFHLLDLGELSLPPVASGIQQNLLIRLWANPGGTQIGVATPQIALGGLYLLPKSGNHGVLSRGLAIPTFSAPVAGGRFTADVFNDRTYVGMGATNLAVEEPVTPAPFYRGALPRLTPSVNALDLLDGARRTDLAMLYRDEVLADAPIGYWPFDDAVPTYAVPLVGATSSFYGAVAVGAAGAIQGIDKAVTLTAATGYAMASGIVSSGPEFTFECWSRCDSIGTSGLPVLAEVFIPGAATGRAIFYQTGTQIALQVYRGASSMALLAPISAPPEASFHHLTFVLGAARHAIYRDATLVASVAIGPIFLGGAGNARIGALNAGQNWIGAIDEPAFYNYGLSSSRIAAHHAAGISPTAGAPAPLIRAAESFAAVSLTYRPRFRFLKSF